MEKDIKRIDRCINALTYLKRCQNVPVCEMTGLAYKGKPGKFMSTKRIVAISVIKLL